MLDPAIDAVSRTRAQVAAITALAPLWDVEARAMTGAQIEGLSREFDSLAEGPADALHVDGDRDAEGAGGVEQPGVLADADTRVAVGRLRAAVGDLESVLMAQA